MTIEIPENEAERYRELAQARGLTVDRWLLELADTAVSESQPLSGPDEPASGMVEENGLLVYRTGNPLPAHVIDHAIHNLREERSLHLRGDLP